MPRQRLGSLLKPAQHHAASSHTFMQRPAVHHLRQEQLLPRQAASTSDVQPPQFDFSHIPVTRGDRPILQPKFPVDRFSGENKQAALDSANSSELNSRQKISPLSQNYLEQKQEEAERLFEKLGLE